MRIDADRTARKSYKSSVRSVCGMDATRGSGLPTGDYRIAPSEKMRNEYGVAIGDVLSGDLELDSGDDQFHKYDVVGPDGTVVLGVLETHGSAELDWLPFSLPQYVYLLVDPEGDLRLVVEVDHSLSPSYTIRDPQREEPLATVTKSRRIFGDWQLKGPDGALRATADRTNTTGNLFSFSTHATYDVSGPDGREIGQFERVRAEGDFVEQFRSAMEVSCSESSVPTEQCLAFAFTLLYHGTKSSGSGSGQ